MKKILKVFMVLFMVGITGNAFAAIVSCAAGTYWGGSACVPCTSRYYCPGFTNVTDPAAAHGRIGCPGITSSQAYSNVVVAAWVSEPAATVATQCYFDRSLGDFWIHEFNKYRGFYRSAGKCYYSPTDQAYNNCPQAKYFSECNAGAFIDSSTPLGPGFTNSCSLCAPGSYTERLSQAGTGPDPSYHYKTACTLCPAGTYGTVSGAISAATCNPCPGGYTDGAAGAGAIGKCIKNVPDGQRVITANGAAVPCDAGYYCSAHTVGYGSTSRQPLSCPDYHGLTHNTALPPTSDAGSGIEQCYASVSNYRVANAELTGLWMRDGGAACYYEKSTGMYTNCAKWWRHPRAGHELVAGSDGFAVNSVRPCLVGTYGPNDRSIYLINGTEFSLNDNLYCISAPVGTYQNETGQELYKNCPTGTYQDTIGQTSCKNCLVGTYQDEIGQTSCKNCTIKPANSFFSGSSVADDCAWTCNQGYALNGGQCEPCGNGAYCKDGIRKQCSGLNTSPNLSATYSIVNGEWFHQYAFDPAHCVCRWTYSDESRTEYFKQARCTLGPVGSEYTAHTWCRVGYYAVDPLGEANWYGNCAPCTNGPMNSDYTARGIPSAPPSTDGNNCAWKCKNDFGETDTGTCAQMCGSGIRTLRVGNISIPLYSVKQTTPSLNINNGAAMCYGSLGTGALGGALNINYSGNTYHSVK